MRWGYLVTCHALPKESQFNKFDYYFDKEKYMLVATFGAGCFWKPEFLLGKVDGVLETAVGYMGGNTDNPSYEEVCADQTGHVEVVQLGFDPKIISYNELLNTFWEIHDPTQVDRQGLDFGKQYRSVIFYSNEEHKTIAEASAEELKKSNRFSVPLATTIELATQFWKAEEYHQKYYEKFKLS